MTNAALDLARRIKAYQAHVAGKPNQDRFIELCDELFAVLRQEEPHVDLKLLEEDIGYDPARYPLHAAIEQVGIYPEAWVGGEKPYEKRDDYMNGWNAAV